MLGQAAHAGLQLLLRQGVEDEVNTWAGRGVGSGPGPPPGPQGAPRGPRLTLAGRVPQHVLLEGRVARVGEAGVVKLREPGLEVRPLLGRPWKGMDGRELGRRRLGGAGGQGATLPTVVKTRQPMLSAMAMAAWPTPPEPEWMSTVSPRFMRPRTSSE